MAADLERALMGIEKVFDLAYASMVLVTASDLIVMVSPKKRAILKDPGWAWRRTASAMEVD